MKYLPLVWSALWRKRPRTIFTMASIAVAFLLYGLLYAVNNAFNKGVEVAGADRLVVISKYSLTQPLPYSFLNEIRGIDGVAAVTWASWFGGIYQDERNFFAQFPVDAASYLEMYPEIVLPAEQKDAFLRTRTGAIVAKTLADRFGWKIGDRIPIQATIWPAKTGNTWEFDLVGIFDTADPSARGQYEMMLFNHEYFDEARVFGQGIVGWYIVRTRDPEQNATVAKAIDERFRNSTNPTKTDSEKAFNQSFIKQMGDIGLIVKSILGAVFFTLLFLTGNTMMQSVRERVPELAVLKTLGFGNTRVLVLVLAESAVLCVLAALLGLGIATVLLPPIAAKLPGFAGMGVDAQTFAIGVALAALLALAVGLPPALRAARLSIVDALAGR
ncbi:ABC transporter permease [Fontimonas sp. SYSU GA230001]|uniref:ABC transporter permease n=1 Tax=Fontimonas sp. SYSU GA230001 TaxID=3142450 RepID=UPI0032B5684F